MAVTERASGIKAVEVNPSDLIIFDVALLRGSPQNSDRVGVTWNVEWRYVDASRAVPGRGGGPGDGCVARDTDNIDNQIQSADEWMAAQ